MTRDLGQTPSQTLGPFFSMRLGGERQNVVPLPEGSERVVITGRVLDGEGNRVEDALLETWQADPEGRYRHPDDRRDPDLDPAFTGFARVLSDFETGEYRLETFRPGHVPDPEGEPQAPHIAVIIQSRGMLNPLFTRIYFSDETPANDQDLVLRMVPEERRNTLIATLKDGSVPKEYQHDIRLQGDNETVFLDF